MWNLLLSKLFSPELHKCDFLYVHKQIRSKVPILSYFVEPKPPSGNYYVSCFLTDKTVLCYLEKMFFLQYPVILLLGNASVRNFAALSTLSSLLLGANIGLSAVLAEPGCFTQGVGEEWILLFWKKITYL